MCTYYNMQRVVLSRVSRELYNNYFVTINGTCLRNHNIVLVN